MAELAALCTFNRKIRDLIKKSQEELAEKSIEEYFDYVVPNLGPVFSLYDELLRAFGTTNVEVFNKKLNSMVLDQQSHNRKSFEDEAGSFLDAQLLWNNFVDSLDQKFPDFPRSSEQLPNLRLEYLDETLGDVTERLSAVDCQVKVVSFSPREGAKIWKTQKQVPFEVYLDPDRKLYAQLGMVRSLSRTYREETIFWYIDEIMTGKQKKDDMYPGDDSYQVGGDFILNTKGEVVQGFVYPDPIRRPKIEDVLDVIQLTS